MCSCWYETLFSSWSLRPLSFLKSVTEWYPVECLYNILSEVCSAEADLLEATLGSWLPSALEWCKSFIITIVSCSVEASMGLFWLCCCLRVCFWCPWRTTSSPVTRDFRPRLCCRCLRLWCAAGLPGGCSPSVASEDWPRGAVLGFALSYWDQCSWGNSKKTFLVNVKAKSLALFPKCKLVFFKLGVETSRKVSRELKGDKDSRGFFS